MNTTNYAFRLNTSDFSDREVKEVKRWCCKIQGSTTVKNFNIESVVKIRSPSAAKLKYFFKIFSELVIMLR